MKRLNVTALRGKKQSIYLRKMYLTGTVDRWNSAKRCELHDRVNHVG